jgi:hypothetical protein
MNRQRQGQAFGELKISPAEFGSRKLFGSSPPKQSARSSKFARSRLHICDTMQPRK